MADDKTDPTLADVLVELRKISGTLVVTMWAVLVLGSALGGMILALGGK